MHSLNTYSIGPANRYSAKNMAKPVTFICRAPEAKQVSLVGTFNSWDPAAHVMQRQPDGAWLLQVPMTHGHHHYMFWIDGELRLDPRAHGIARNENNERVSMLAIS
jgi:1,4-alpha-glucan branching enzyme